ncbi:Aquaporin-1 [Vermiconidia calcicola]|uniref:Aquaporin-1 n=1 Tax=Vermiconidia calcicola TaxID=1690605 RepID=A0ACC3N5R9_9PEZI|nr:Aquaporin-1 [Vermiconidia calcicola]
MSWLKKEVSRDNPGGEKELRLPLIGFMPNKIRNHFVAAAGEFVGTFCFLFFAFAGTQVANAAAAGASGNQLSQVPNTGTLMYISLSFGFSLAVNAWIFFRISGGLFNPAVSLALAMVGGVTWIRAGIALVSQLLASIAVSGVVSGLFPGEMGVTTSLGPGVSLAQGVFIEMFLTAELIFTILMLAAEKHKATFIAPIGIGLSLFIAELAGVFFTGGSLNPARSFGPCVVLAAFPSEHWIYWVGPFLGVLIAVGFYKFCKILEYETANPGQDFNEKEDEEFNVDEDNAATHEDVARPIPGSASSKNTDQTPGEGGRASSANYQQTPTKSAPRRSTSNSNQPRTNGRSKPSMFDGNTNDQRSYGNDQRPYSSDQRPYGGGRYSQSSAGGYAPNHTDLDGYNGTYDNSPIVERGHPLQTLPPRV